MIWKRLFFLLSAGILAFTLVTVTTSSSSPARATSGPVFTVMNTSESPPDGVYFRDLPDWNTSRTYGLGVFMNEQVQLQCSASGPAVGPYNDQLWYYVLNVSRPVNYDGQPNQGMVSAHYINDGQLANVVDAGVPACVNNQPPASTPSPVVSLAQGPAAPAGYRYAMTLSGFPANTGVSVTCYDSVSPGGFYTFSLGTDSSGHAFTQDYCYSGDGPDHWVLAGGVQSNHVAWGGTTGGPGPIPNPTPPPGGDPRPSGDITFPPLQPNASYVLPPKPRDTSLAHRALNQSILLQMQGVLASWAQLGYSHAWGNGKHYLDHSGTARWFSMSELDKQLPGFRGQYQYWLTQNLTIALPVLRSTPSTDGKIVSFDTAGTTQNWAGYNANNYQSDLHWALGHFFVRMRGRTWVGPVDGTGDRPVVIQYRSFMYDIYNFDKTSKFYEFETLAHAGWASEFLERGESPTITVTTTLRALNIGNVVVQFN